MRQRRSFKPHMFRPDAPPREVVESLLEAANWAPSHGQTEPWRFVVFAGEARERLAKIWCDIYEADATPRGLFKQEQYDAQRKRAFDPPVWIALVLSPALKPDGTPAFPEEEESQALACAVQNLHLLATAHGLGGQWTTGKGVSNPAVAKALGIQAPRRLMGFFFLGYPAVDWPAGKRGDLSAKVTWA